MEDLPPHLHAIHRPLALKALQPIRDEHLYKSSSLSAVFLESPPTPGLHPPAQNTMGVFQDETFFDALRLALATRMPPPLICFALPGQAPTIFLTSPACYDFMNPTTTKPFMILNPIKTLQPSYAAIVLSYAIVPLHLLQAQAPPSHSTASLHPPDPTFWNVVERVVEHLVHGVTALAWLFSEIVRTAPQKVRSAGLFFFFSAEVV